MRQYLYVTATTKISANYLFQIR